MDTGTTKEAGFTLIETLISATILIVTLVGFITLAATSLQTYQIAKQRYIATKIAQEGIEFVMNKRDNHVLCVGAGTCPLANWQENLVPTVLGLSWEIDATDTSRLLPNRTFKTYDATKSICIRSNPPQHKGKFSVCQGSETPIPGNFNRKVTITALGPEKIKAQSVVTWNTRFFTHQVELDIILFGLP